MNLRRDFLRKLVLGAAALPVAVKVVMEKPVPAMQLRTLPKGWSGTPQNFMDEIAWVHADDIKWDYRWEGDRLIQSRKGKDFVIHKLDSRPLRFNA